MNFVRDSERRMYLTEVFKGTFREWDPVKKRVEASGVHALVLLTPSLTRCSVKRFANLEH